MFRISRLFIATNIILFVILTIGCLRTPVRVAQYWYKGNMYLSRTEAESLHRKDLEKLLSNCQTAHHSIDEEFIFVMPTRRWIIDEMAIVWGEGPKADLKDFSATGNQMALETDYNLLIKSGVFGRIKIVEATDGNGQNEYLSSKDSYKIIVEIEGKEREKIRSYLLIAPGGERSVQLGGADISYSSHFGWDWFADYIQEFVSE